jgi:hypothetical protein
MKRLFRLLAICIPVLAYAESPDTRHDYTTQLKLDNILSSSKLMCSIDDPLVVRPEYHSPMCRLDEPQRQEEQAEEPLIFKKDDQASTSGGKYE